ncbi:hypothetical protein M4H08_001917 [Listeria monocytogenes]|uniref:hypothetical protein n=1 Tax=Listeria seeligeri TaxID=1640 RepID=UPI0022EBB8C5|nr:hypothetical protein [Listeria seeligeri]EJE1078080.1 hypothetical protein [Listeria monocytogenes]EJE1814573.1 hypothetical protein [Listeria monocytogenes]EKZ3968257.1 hypothetical protein [Listeria monocytogenes]EKZ4000263.1 hypothetical protein [Listeria monocytogenes]EKZ4005979.1 hypothetical protein [Listeria monocytogenes]
MRLTFDIETVDDALDLQKIIKILAASPDAGVALLQEEKTIKAEPKTEEHETETPTKVEELSREAEEEQTLTLADVKKAVSRFEGGTKNVQVKFVMVTAFKVTALNKLKPSDYQDFIEMLDEREKEFGLSQDTDEDTSENEKTKKTSKNKPQKGTSDEEVLTMDALRVMVRPFVQSKNNKAVKKILRENFGIEAMAELDEEDYPAFVAELEKSKKKLGL